jgi:phytoene dehydrogenase-like protein
MSHQADVIIVGAGIAGLACARELTRAGVRCLLLDAGDAVGGRIRTDVVDGFLIDRGFQVLLTAYPECREVLDLSALRLRTFYPGALVHLGDRFHKVAHPLRKPLDAISAAASPLITLADLPALARFSAHALAGSLDDLWSRPERTSIDHLRAAGLSGRIIDRFFRPFFGGVFFDPDLQTSSRMLEFTFRMFASGQTAVPERGMQAIPEQLAAGLPEGTLHLNTRAAHAEAHRITLQDGDILEARAVVIAADGAEAERLIPGAGRTEWQGTTSLSFAAPASPIAEPILILDGDGAGPINHLCVMSNVAPSYAPPGQHLISANMTRLAELPDSNLEAAARRQLHQWFGEAVAAWRLLRIDRIPRALPRQVPPALEPARRSVRTPSGAFICGDHRENASINGAIASGRRAAAEVLTALG